MPYNHFQLSRAKRPRIDSHLYIHERFSFIFLVLSRLYSSINTVIPLMLMKKATQLAIRIAMDN